jgi:HPt (histidine-containing phosphotransfer) domain-containing protein
MSEEERKAAAEKAKESQKDSLTGKLMQTGRFDVSGAISLLGNEQLYWTVLKDYYRVIDKKKELIHSFYETQDWKNYTIEVHALKSASRQIGANGLADLAAKLEKAANDKEYGIIVENQEKLLRMYAECQAVLAPFMEDEDAAAEPQKGAISAEELTSLFGELRQAIDDLDMDKIDDAVQKLAEYTYPEEQKALLEQLKEAAENMDVDTCLIMIEQWEMLL